MSEEREAVELDDNMPPVEEIEESAPPEEEIETPEPVEEPEPEKKPDGDRVQKRINKITREKHEARARAEAAERRLKELEAQKPQAATVAEEPKIEDYDYDDEAHRAALVRYQVAQEMARERERMAIESQETAKQQAAREFQAKVDAAGIEDYAEVIQNLVEVVPIPETIVDAIQRDERGPELAYYLGNHLDVADKLVGLPPMQAALELGKISAGLSKGKQIKTTTAPEPVKTVGSGGGTAPKEPEEMSMDEIMEIDI